MNPADTVAMLAGALTALGMVAQVILMLTARNSSDASWAFAILMLAGLMLWLYHGLKKHDLALIFWSAIGVTCCTTVLVLKVIYR